MQNAATQEQTIDYGDAQVCDILRFAREYYGISIEQVEKSIRIRACLIEAMESGDYSKLPGRVYAIGFIRTYAEFLELNPDEIVNLYKRQASAAPVQNNVIPFPAETSKNNTPKTPLIIASLLALTVIVGLWASANKPDTRFTPMHSAQASTTSVIINPAAAEPEIQPLNQDLITQPLYN